MNRKPRVPLLAKVFGWLVLHLLILALCFAGFIAWQLGLGLDSLLTGSTGERLRVFGDSARDRIESLPRLQWNEALKSLSADKNVTAGIFNPGNPAEFPRPIPANVLERARTSLPPLPPRGARPPPGLRDNLNFREGRGPPPRGFEPPDRRPDDFRPRGGEMPNLPPRPDNAPLAPSQPVFLLRGNHGEGYWAGVRLMLPGHDRLPRHRELLLIRSDRLDGSGMFFEFKPWLWGGLAVLALSLAFWAPFVWNITGYLRRLTAATGRIAAGRFDVMLPSRGNDELGNLGNAIESMALRLEHLVGGQKRFLGDAAHELCAPLARLRTGLGILEMKLGDDGQVHLARIDTEVQELATLVEEILAFARVGNRTPRPQPVLLDKLAREVTAREGGASPPVIEIAPDLTVFADPPLLSRALGNLVRNARIHAGPAAHVIISTAAAGEWIELSVADDGPGVPAGELPRLFEPFYRPDRSRTRDTGGSGLGLSIVRAAAEAMGGEVWASLPTGGGFLVTMRLRKLDDETAPGGHVSLNQ